MKAKTWLAAAWLGPIFLTLPVSAETIVEGIIRRAQQGDANAQATLGLDYLYGVTRYRDGSQVKKDTAAGEKWLLHAANQGHASAQYILGMAYYEGERVKRDETQALLLLDRFLNQAYEEEKIAKSKTEKIRFNLVVSKVEYVLGRMAYQECDLHYISSDCGSMRKGRSLFLPRNYSAARRWFLKAAKRGNRKAQYQLATIYEAGRGVPQDYRQAAVWYQRAAENGHDNARRPLGELYLKMKNYVAAHMWLNLANATTFGPSPRAAELRDELAKNMTPAQVAKAQKMATDWAKKFAK